MNTLIFSESERQAFDHLQGWAVIVRSDEMRCRRVFQDYYMCLPTDIGLPRTLGLGIPLKHLAETDDRFLFRRESNATGIDSWRIREGVFYNLMVSFHPSNQFPFNLYVLNGRSARVTVLSWAILCLTFSQFEFLKPSYDLFGLQPFRPVDIANLYTMTMKIALTFSYAPTHHLSVLRDVMTMEVSIADTYSVLFPLAPRIETESGDLINPSTEEAMQWEEQLAVQGLPTYFGRHIGLHDFYISYVSAVEA